MAHAPKTHTRSQAPRRIGPGLSSARWEAERTDLEALAADFELRQKIRARLKRDAWQSLALNAPERRALLAALDFAESGAFELWNLRGLESLLSEAELADRAAGGRDPGLQEAARVMGWRRGKRAPGTNWRELALDLCVLRGCRGEFAYHGPAGVARVTGPLTLVEGVEFLATQNTVSVKTVRVELVSVRAQARADLSAYRQQGFPGANVTDAAFLVSGLRGLERS